MNGRPPLPSAWPTAEDLDELGLPPEPPTPDVVDPDDDHQDDPDGDLVDRQLIDMRPQRVAGSKRAVIHPALRSVEYARGHLAAWADEHDLWYHAIRIPTVYWFKLAIRAPLTVGKLAAWAGWLLSDWEGSRGDLRRARAAASGGNGPEKEVAKARRSRNVALTARWMTAALIGAVGWWVIGRRVLHATWWEQAADLYVALALAGWWSRPRGEDGESTLAGRRTRAIYEQPIRADNIVRALAGIGIARLTKAIDESDGKAVGFIGEVARTKNDTGVLVEIILPAGVPAAAVVRRSELLAAGLMKPVSCVFASTMPDHPANFLHLFIAHKPIGLRDPAPWPLLKKGRWTNFFEPVLIGEDEQGNPVEITLFEASILIGAIPGAGKALALDTPLPTPEGWTTMGEIQVGDRVLDESGVSCSVTYKSPVFVGHDCYDVVFDDGSVITADADHLWWTWDEKAWRSKRTRAALDRRGPARQPALSRDQSHKWTGPEVRTTRVLAATLTVTRGSETRANHRIPVAGQLDLPDADLPLDPYLFGCWLGDGHSRGPYLTTMDPEIVSAFEADGWQLEPTASQTSGRATTYSIRHTTDIRHRDFTRCLHAAGIPTPRQAGQKHIPAAYLRSSSKQRLALLQGLMDTDGNTTNGCCEIGLSNHQLISDARELALSLGYKAHPVRHKLSNFGTDVWRFSFTAPEPVFRIARKVALQRIEDRPNSATRWRTIVAVRPVTPVDTQCITVDSPSHLYLAGREMIPTHNTWTQRVIALAAALDVRTELHVWAYKGGPDWAPFRKIAHAIGISPRVEDIAPMMLADFKALRKEVERRADAVEAAFPRFRSEKLTDHMANVRELGLHPIVVIIDEYHWAFISAQWGPMFKDHVEDFVRRARAYGVLVCLSTQKPSSISTPTDLRDNISLRIALRIVSQTATDMVLGSGAWKEGRRTNHFPKRARGLAMIVGEDEHPIIVRVPPVTGEQCEQVIGRIYERKVAEGWLTGMAAGQLLEPDTETSASLLEDLMACWPVDALSDRPDRRKRRITTEDAVSRLSARDPNRYAGWTTGQLTLDLGKFTLTSGTNPKHVDAQTGTARSIDYAELLDALDRWLIEQAELAELAAVDDERIAEEYAAAIAGQQALEETEEDGDR